MLPGELDAAVRRSASSSLQRRASSERTTISDEAGACGYDDSTASDPDAPTSEEIQRLEPTVTRVFQTAAITDRGIVVRERPKAGGWQEPSSLGQNRDAALRPDGTSANNDVSCRDQGTAILGCGKAEHPALPLRSQLTHDNVLYHA